MDDVEYFIQLSLDDIHRKADISASRLNYQCFKGILNKVSDTVSYNKDILSEEEIEKFLEVLMKMYYLQLRVHKLGNS